MEFYIHVSLLDNISCFEQELLMGQCTSIFDLLRLEFEAPTVISDPKKETFFYIQRYRYHMHFMLIFQTPTPGPLTLYVFFLCGPL